MLQKHLEEFYASGLNDNTIHLAGYESVEEKIIEDGFDEQGRKKKKKIGGHWKVPYFDPLTNELHYYRIKPDEPKIENKGKQNERAIKYLTPKGAKPHLFFSRQIENWKEILDTNKTIYITEGEKKCSKLIQEGFTTVAVSGVWCWKSEDMPIKDLDYLSKTKRKVVLVFDADWQTNPKVRQALNELAKELKSRGLSVMYANCPGPEKGIDDWIMEHGIGNWKNYLSVLEERFSETSIYEYEVKEAAKQMLLSPDLMQTVVDDVHKLGVVDEEENIKLLYLAMASHKMDKCVGVIVKGESSTGKTFLVKTIMSLMPNGVAETITGHSTQALSYWTDISHKVICVGESRPPSDEFWETDSLWRQLIEDNEIIRKIVTKDNNGKQVLDTITVKGPVVYISTTTAPNLHEENENRLLIINTNDTETHIKKVLQMQRQEEGMSVQEKLKLKIERDFIIDKHKYALSLLNSIPVDSIYNPLAPKLKFNTYGSYTMRDQKKLFRILRILAFLHQFQRGIEFNSTVIPPFHWAKNDPVESNFKELRRNSGFNSTFHCDSTIPLAESKGKNVCVSNDDYRIAYDILKTVFNSNASEIPEHLLRKWNMLNNQFNDSTFNVKDVKKALIVKTSGAYKILKQMEELKMVEQIEQDLNAVSKKKYKEYRCIYFTNTEAEMTKPEELDNTADKLQYPIPLTKNDEKIEENKEGHTHTFGGSISQWNSGMKENFAQNTNIIENQGDLHSTGSKNIQWNSGMKNSLLEGLDIKDDIKEGDET